MVQDHFWKKHKKDYSSLLYQKGLKISPVFVPQWPIFKHFDPLGILLPLIRHGVTVKVTPLRVHLYSKSNH